MSIINTVQQETAKTWKYFKEWLSSEYENGELTENFEELPFEFQFGVFISFFNSVSTDVDIYSTEPEAMQDAIIEAFKQYEEYLFLDS